MTGPLHPRPFPSPSHPECPIYEVKDEREASSPPHGCPYSYRYGKRDIASPFPRPVYPFPQYEARTQSAQNSVVHSSQLPGGVASVRASIDRPGRTPGGSVGYVIDSPVLPPIPKFLYPYPHMSPLTHRIDGPGKVPIPLPFPFPRILNRTPGTRPAALLFPGPLTTLFPSRGDSFACSIVRKYTGVRQGRRKGEKSSDSLGAEGQRIQRRCSKNKKFH